MRKRIVNRLKRWVVEPLRRWEQPPAPPEPPPPVELQLVWPASRLGTPPTGSPPAGYALRTYQPGDADGFIQLMARAGYPDWNMIEFDKWLQKVLPNGLFFLIHQLTGTMAATAMAVHNPSSQHPFGGTLSCVATDPEHRGQGLGYVVSAEVTGRLLGGGYTDIYLQTDDWRLPAIKTYLRMGWVPFLFQDDMPERWRVVCRNLGWPYTSEHWPAVSCQADSVSQVITS